MLRRQLVSNLALSSVAAALKLCDIWRIVDVAARLRICSAQSLVIGAIIPLSNDDYGMTLGVEEAQHASQMFSTEVQSKVERVSTDVDSVSRAAERLRTQHGISAVVGGGTDEQCAALSDFCTKEKLLFLNTVNASDTLRNSRCDSNTFHVEASEQMKRDAIDLAAKAHGAPSDSSIARGSAAGDSALSSAPALQSSARVWHGSLNKYGADTLNTRFRTRFGQSMSERAWSDWFAVKVLWETFLRIRTSDASAFSNALTKPATRFDGHKGRQLSFRSWDHQLRQPLYVVTQRPNGESRVVEYPANNTDADVQQALDVLGTSAGNSACRFSP